MKKIMTKVIKSSIISSLGLFILGLLLVVQSEVTIISLSYVIGGILIAIGVITGLRYTKSINEGTKNDLDVVYGIVCIVLGILVILNPQAIASVIPLIIGLIIIISSAFKIQYSLELKKESNSLWKSTLTIGLITTICGLVLIFNPFKGAILITKIVGVLIVVYAILDIVSTITIRRTVNTIQKAIEEKIEDANVIEDNTDKEKKKRKIKIDDKKGGNVNE